MERGRSRGRAALVTAAVLVVGAVVAASVLHSRTGAPATLTVMTRNLYLGGDITRPVRASAGRTGGEAFTALADAGGALVAMVARTDFTVRSRLLAAEIAEAHPDVVGLQEAALWRSGPLRLALGEPVATTVDQDFLALLLSGLDARGVHYDAVATQVESDVEAPAQLPGRAEDVRLTVRDVLLVRPGTKVEVAATGARQYRRRLEVSLGGTPYAFVRGFVWADLLLGGHRVRVVSTHLESQSADVALGQAAELVDGPLTAAEGPTVVLGDLNSDPADLQVRAGEQVAGAAASRRLTGAGWSDAWVAVRGDEPGATAALSETLDDPTAAGLDRRLDAVLTRGTPGRALTATRADLTGDEPADRDTASGLWPSDHAGLTVDLRLG